MAILIFSNFDIAPYTPMREDGTVLWGPRGWSETFVRFDRPTGPNEVQDMDFLVENTGAATVTGVVVTTRTTLYTPPGVSNPTLWRDNATRHILPRIQLDYGSGTWGPMGAPLIIPFVTGGGGSVVVNVRFTSVLTDTRTGLAYDYGLYANANDHPFAFAIHIDGSTAVRMTQLIGQ